MISPILLQLLFWAGVAGSLYGSYILYTPDNWVWVFPLVFGPLLVRVIFEGALLSFRIYDQLRVMTDRLPPPDSQA